MVVEVDVVRAGSTEWCLAQHLTGSEYSGTPQGILASQCCHWGRGGRRSAPMNQCSTGSWPRRVA